jgi:hypothetical protein
MNAVAPVPAGSSLHKERQMIVRKSHKRSTDRFHRAAATREKEFDDLIEDTSAVAPEWDWDDWAADAATISEEWETWSSADDWDSGDSWAPAGRWDVDQLP